MCPLLSKGCQTRQSFQVIFQNGTLVINKSHKGEKPESQVLMAIVFFYRTRAWSAEVGPASLVGVRSTSLPQLSWGCHQPAEAPHSGVPVPACRCPVTKRQPSIRAEKILPVLWTSSLSENVEDATSRQSAFTHQVCQWGGRHNGTNENHILHPAVD